MPALSAEYPLLMTNAKEDVYMGSGYKHVASLRMMKSEPFMEMHPDSARRFGLDDGDMAYVETNKGRIVQRLAFNDDLDPRIVITSFGWWFPERGGLFGWDESNINVLTRSEPPYDPAFGTFEIRGIPCRVGPVAKAAANETIPRVAVTGAE